jgi:ribose 5-phosphate isomerase A
MTDPAEPADLDKAAAGRAAVAEVRDGMLVGLGTGSTATQAIRALGTRVAQGLTVRAVATSRASEALARQLGLVMLDFADVPRVDLTIDGLDGAATAVLVAKLRQIVLVERAELVAATP